MADRKCVRGRRGTVLVCALAAAAGAGDTARGETWDWAAPVSGLWSVPENWMPAGAPPPGWINTASIAVAGSPYTVTADAPGEVSVRLSSPDATLLIPAGVEWSASDLTMTGGRLDLQGDLRAPSLNRTGGSVVGGGRFLLNGLTFSDLASDPIPTVVLKHNITHHAGPAAGQTFIVEGSLYDLKSILGTISVEPALGTQVLTSLSGVGCTNAGALYMRAGPAGLTQDRIRSFTNAPTGLLAVEQNTALDGPWTNRGTVVVEEGRTLKVRSSFTQSGGTLDNRGTISVESTFSFTFAGGTMIGNPVEFSGGGTLVNQDTVTPARFAFRGGNLKSPAGAGVVLGRQQSLLVMDSGAAQLGPSSINEGTIVLQAAPGRPPGRMSFAGTLTNRGTIEVIDAPIASGLPCQLEGTRLVNEGTLTLGGNTSLEGELSNSGQVSVPAGKLLTLRAYLLPNGVGHTMDGGAIDLEGELVIGGKFTHNGGRISGPGRLVFNRGPVTFNAPEPPTRFFLQGQTTLASQRGERGQDVTVEAGSSSSSLFLAGAAFTNAGTLRLGGGSAAAAITAGTFVNRGTSAAAGSGSSTPTSPTSPAAP